MLKNSIISIVGLAIALVAGLTAMGAVAKDKVAEFAVSLQPANGFAFERLAANSLKASVAANDGQFPNSVDSATEDLAKQAFLSEPVTPEAIAVLALGGTEGKKRELMHQAFALSRRQQLVIGWMIVDAGTREDISAVLSHYDTMLRTSSSAASVVIPTMAGALANSNFVEPFARLLSKNPPWASRFWGVVVARPEAIENAAKLRERLYADDEARESYRDASLISELVNNKRFETAENLYQLLAGQRMEASLLKNGSFELEPQYPPLDWQLLSNGEYGAAVAGGNLRLSAISGSGGLFARQLVKLPSAILKITVKSDTSIPKGANISINMKCAEILNNAPRPIRIALTGELTSQHISNQQSGCNFYWLEVVGRSAEGGDGFDVDLDSVSLRLK
ncbi:hypothetical protein HUO14_14060 [Parasphingorhabdus flavimaris]|uniref:Uncharacterized protein n=1 Tax=Parasphingorhabdus flavimaris TaxID=266812 RepID=A0ABX2N5N4_9SPHN|nr:hypothetical protein [Parasphingorhabdus flavimaris]NVD29020.1 hypothetical protein [Parasphingorhabdus flavimaris]